MVIDLGVLLADRYQLSEVIGCGGMAEVYRATDIKLNRPVAVKVLLDRAGEKDDRTRFIAEARTLAMLSHSGLVTVLDAGFGGNAAQHDVTVAPEYDRPFLVMELVDGPTMSQLMRGGPMPIEEVGKFAVQIAEALAYVHARGVVHRDVKPGNVLVGPDDLVKLADFGIARLIEQRTRHTRSGLAIGTAAYIAPEQVNGGEVAGAADVYALGLVLLEAITGKREYAGAPAEAALARLHRPPEIPPLPGAWPDLLTTMTALDPTDRPTAADVATTLRGDLGHPAPSPTVGVADVATSPILAAGPGGDGAEDPAAPGDQPVTGDTAGSPGIGGTEAGRTEPGGTDPTGPTRPMTDPSVAPVAAQPPPQPPPQAAPRPAASDTLRAAMERRTRNLATRLRSTSSETRGAVAALAALVLLLVVIAAVSGDEPAPVIPENTPADLREPLTNLHVAVNGEDE